MGAFWLCLSDRALRGQRVAIACALAMKPALMLFDEATFGLDLELVGEILGVMRDLARPGMAMVFATHELGFARDVANRGLFMETMGA